MIEAPNDEIEDLLRRWSGEHLVLHLDRSTGVWIVIAVHSTHLGPGTGGTRMKTYPDLAAGVRDALALAEGMTYKFATSGFPRGGAKGVLVLSTDIPADERGPLLRRYGSLIHQLGGLFRTGPDVGTSPKDMDIVAETGAPYVHSRTRGAGGAGDSAPATAVGVFHGIRVCCEVVYGTPTVQGKRVLIQGAGNVGRRLVDLLLDAGATVMVSDIDRNALHRLSGVETVPAEAVYDTECDIFAPCALGGILNAANIERLRCRAVCGAANNQLATPEDGERLQARGILYAPDFVVSLGGALAVTGIESLGWSPESARERTIEIISGTLRQVFEFAHARGITPSGAARMVADQRLAAPSTTAYV